MHIWNEKFWIYENYVIHACFFDHYYELGSYSKFWIVFYCVDNRVALPCSHAHRFMKHLFGRSVKQHQGSWKPRISCCQSEKNCYLQQFCLNNCASVLLRNLNIDHWFLAIVPRVLNFECEFTLQHFSRILEIKRW